MTPSSVNLNDRKSIAKIDKSNMLSSIEALGKQIEHAWADTRSITITPKQPITNVVVAGMGGSGLGADLIKHLYLESLSVPFDYVHGYALPAYVDQSTLVILSSYSGNTEEVMACAEMAEKKQATIVCIAAGGALTKLAQEKHWPIYVIDPKYNPSNQPRMAIGYSVVGTLGLCERAGVIDLQQPELESVVTMIQQLVKDYTVEVDHEQNLAKLLAYSMFSKQVVLLAPDFLEGAAHVAANQSNENGKTFTNYFVIPEVNHHLLEALRYPTNLHDSHIAIFFQTLLAHPQNQKRVTLTQEIFEDHGMETMRVTLDSNTQLNQVFELITIMAFATFYETMLEGIDPSPIPIVESFKEKLKKHP